MTEATLHDLRLIGTATSGGGEFRNVRVTGEAVLNGDTRCRTLSCTGNIRLNGSLHSDTLKLTGDCRIDGNLQAIGLGGIGEVEVSGGLRADRVKMTGDLRVGGNCEAESLELKGGVTVGGLLSAENMSIIIHGPCRAKEIGGGTITVKRSKAVLFKRMFGQGASAFHLTADLIEGDALILEHVRAEVVRGNRVVLGPGCDIGRVEFRGDLTIHNNAVIREQLRI